MGAGGTMQEAKHQAAGAVLEEISSPTENIKDTKQQDHEEMKVRVNETDLDEDDKTNQPNEDGAIIDTCHLMISTVMRISNKLK